MTADQSVTRDGTPWSPVYVDRVDGERCLGCGRCHKVCGQDVLATAWVDEEGGFVDADDGDAEKMVTTVANKGACIGCGACLRVCSKKALITVTA